MTKFDPNTRISGSDIIDLINFCEGDTSDSGSEDSDSDSDVYSASDASTLSPSSEKKKKKERKRRREQKKTKKKKSSRVKTEPASAASDEQASSSGTQRFETTAPKSPEAASQSSKQVTL